MNEFLGSVLAIVLPTLAAILAGLIVQVLHRMAKKYGIEISQKSDERLKVVVEDAIRMAEEHARRTSKDGALVLGIEKRELAISKALIKAADDPVLSKVTPEQVQATIDSQLPLVRAEIGVA